MTDQPETNGDECRSNESTGDGVQDLGDDYRDQGGPQGKEECAGAYRGYADAQKAFSGAHVDQGASRDLQDQSGDRADGQDEAYMELRPRPRGQIAGDEGPPTRLNIGQEEGEPVKASQAPA